MASFVEIADFFAESEAFYNRRYYALPRFPEEVVSDVGNLVGFFLDVYSTYQDSSSPDPDAKHDLLSPETFQEKCGELGYLANAVTHFVHDQRATSVFAPENSDKVFEAIDEFSFSTDSADHWLNRFVVSKISYDRQPNERLEDLYSNLLQLQIPTEEQLDLIRALQESLFDEQWINVYGNLPAVVAKIAEGYGDGYQDYFGDEEGRLTSGGIHPAVLAGAAVGVGLLVLGLLLLMVASKLGIWLIISGLKSLVIAALRHHLRPDQLLEDVIRLHELPNKHMTQLGSPADSVTIYPFGRNFSSLISSHAFLAPKSHAANPADHICIYTGAHKGLLVAATIDNSTTTKASPRYRRLRKSVGYKRDRGVLELESDSYIRISPMIPIPSPVSTHFDTTISDFPSASIIDHLK